MEVPCTRGLRGIAAVLGGLAERGAAGDCGGASVQTVALQLCHSLLVMRARWASSVLSSGMEPYVFFVFHKNNPWQ